MFGKLKIGVRLGAGFALVLIIAIALTAIGIARMGDIQHHLDEVVTQS